MGIYCEDFRGNWLRYNGIALYFQHKMWKILMQQTAYHLGVAVVGVR